MSDTAPTHLRHTPSTVIPAKAGIQVCRPAKDADTAESGREGGVGFCVRMVHRYGRASSAIG